MGHPMGRWRDTADSSSSGLIARDLICWNRSGLLDACVPGATDETATLGGGVALTRAVQLVLTGDDAVVLLCGLNPWVEAEGTGTAESSVAVGGGIIFHSMASVWETQNRANSFAAVLQRFAP